MCASLSEIHGASLILASPIILWQHPAMIKFRALSDDRPDLAHAPLLHSALLALPYTHEHVWIRPPIYQGLCKKYQLTDKVFRILRYFKRIAMRADKADLHSGPWSMSWPHWSLALNFN